MPKADVSGISSGVVLWSQDSLPSTQWRHWGAFLFRVSLKRARTKTKS